MAAGFARRAHVRVAADTDRTCEPQLLSTQGGNNAIQSELWITLLFDRESPQQPHAASVDGQEDGMSLITVIVTLIVVGVVLWLINTYIPMDGKIKGILNIVVVIAVIVWLLQSFGLLEGLQRVRLG
jgi:hypothetical protein